MKFLIRLQIFIMALGYGFESFCAKAALDAPVREFLSAAQTSKPLAKMSVLVQYRESIVQSILPQSTFWRETNLSLMKKANLELQHQVLGKISDRASIESLWIARGSLANLTAEELLAVAQHPSVEFVHALNRRVRVVPEVSARGRGSESNFTPGLEKIRLPEFRKLYPQLGGSGIKVGILDTGIDPTHPALAGKISAFKDFVSGQDATPYDDNGHGTHVAGTIAGSDVDGLSIGIAPKASLVIGKVFTQTGEYDEKGVLAGMQWMADPDGNPATDDAPFVVSNSWNIDNSSAAGQDPKQDPFCVAIENWSRLGIIAVFAAGNDGPKESSVIVPGACPLSLTVGATDQSDTIAEFSSRGPVNWSSLTLPGPIVVAPGVDVESAAPGGGTAVKSGTSMATPHVAGALALLLQGHSRQDVEKAKSALIRGSQPLGDQPPNFVYGAGRIDLVRALEL